MSKKITALLAGAAMILTLIPSALAVNSDYIGTYYTLNSDAPGYAALQIINCDDSTISARFKRVKNDVEPYIYTFDQGSVSGLNAVVPFHAVSTASSSAFDGNMELTFTGGMINVRLISNLGTELYTGILPKNDGNYFDDPPSPGSGTPAAPSVPSTPAAPAQTQKDVNISINGTLIDFTGKVKPVIIEDRTYVPLRSVLSTMGINVYWDEYRKNDLFQEQLITCTKNDTIVQFARTFNDSGYNVWTLRKWVNSDTGSDATSSIDITLLQPVLIDNSSYIPFRVVSEAFGANVDWDGATSTVLIGCDTNNSYWYPPETIGSMEDFSQSEAQSCITSDYTSVIPDTVVPYFAPASKYYKFKANDQWGGVTIKVYYGGYLEVAAEQTPEEAAPAAGDNNTEGAEQTAEDILKAAIEQIQNLNSETK